MQKTELPPDEEMLLAEIDSTLNPDNLPPGTVIIVCVGDFPALRSLADALFFHQVMRNPITLLADDHVIQSRVENIGIEHGSALDLFDPTRYLFPETSVGKLTEPRLTKREQREQLKGAPRRGRQGVQAPSVWNGRRQHRRW